MNTETPNRVFAHTLRTMGFDIPSRIPDCAWIPAGSMTPVGTPHVVLGEEPTEVLVGCSFQFTEPFRWVEGSFLVSKATADEEEEEDPPAPEDEPQPSLLDQIKATVQTMKLGLLDAYNGNGGGHTVGDWILALDPETDLTSTAEYRPGVPRMRRGDHIQGTSACDFECDTCGKTQIKNEELDAPICDVCHPEDDDGSGHPD